MTTKEGAYAEGLSRITHARLCVAAAEACDLQERVKFGDATIDELRAKLQETTALRTAAYEAACALDRLVLMEAEMSAATRAGVTEEVAAIRGALAAFGMPK